MKNKELFNNIEQQYRYCTKIKYMTETRLPLKREIEIICNTHRMDDLRVEIVTRCEGQDMEKNK